MAKWWQNSGPLYTRELDMEVISFFSHTSTLDTKNKKVHEKINQYHHIMIYDNVAVTVLAITYNHTNHEIPYFDSKTSFSTYSFLIE